MRRNKLVLMKLEEYPPALRQRFKEEYDKSFTPEQHEDIEFLKASTNEKLELIWRKLTSIESRLDK